MHGEHATSPSTPPRHQRPAVPSKLVALLLVIWALMSLQFGTRWYGPHDSTRIWVHAAVENYERYGISQIGLLVVRDIGPANPPDFKYYTHHPAMIVWLPAALTQVLGNSESAVRFGFMAITLLSVVLLYVLVRRLFRDERLAWWAAAFYGLVPMIAYFGAMPSMFHLGLAGGLLFAAVMVNWLRNPTRARLTLLLATGWSMAWSAWPGVFFVAALGITGFFLGDMRHKRAVIAIGVIGFAAVLALLAFYQLQWDGAIPSLLDSFVWRASNDIDTPDSRAFTLVEFAWTTVGHMLVFITPGVIALSIMGIPAFWQQSDRQSRRVILALLGGGIAYQMVFRNASIVHEYYKIMLVPGMAVFAACAWGNLGRRHERRWLRPVMGGLLVVSLITGAGMYIGLTRATERPMLDAAIRLIENHTPATATIHTNLDGRVEVWPIGFYTFRRIEGGIPPTDAPAYGGYYLHCVPNTGHSPEMTVIATDGDCTLLGS